MRFSLTQLLVAVAVLCVCMGSYKWGRSTGRWAGRVAGYQEASDHYQHMLQSYAKKQDFWAQLGGWFREGPVGIISPEPCEDEADHEWYVNYHKIQRP